MFEDEDDVDETLPEARFDAYSMLVIGARLVSDVHDAFGSALMRFHNVLAMHANYRLGRREFAASVGADVEALTRG